jgi:serine/threonine protein phosphatase 1
LLARFLGRKPAREARPSTGGRLVYAVGDVHGRVDALKILLHDIARDALETRPLGPPLLVMLGDYVDRGPDSRAVVDAILAIAAHGAFEVATLKGNHEATLLAFLDTPVEAASWLEFGGGATLASYGVAPPPARPDEMALFYARDAFEAALPPQHRAFYENLELMRVVGDYAFVHAGVRPGVALEDQTPQDLLWIRREFLEAPGPFDKVIVHGHTPVETPQLLKHRLGLDTGAYVTGVLSAIRLEGEDQSLIQARIELRASVAA